MLYAALPGDLRFVVKNTLSQSIFSHPFLRHLGANFVDRFNPKNGVVDSERVLQSIREGAMTVFFPEGTFGRMPGLLPFRMGAFSNAAQAQARVVPVALRGGRSMLRSGSWYPRRAKLKVIIGEPVSPGSPGWEGALALRDRARAEMLCHIAEPDLKFETGEVQKLRPKESDDAF
jgi:1-acyl-sn-glycerol-3-phosphate acyltransferase